MRIAFLSYDYIKNESVPEIWLEKVKFYTGLLDEIASHHEVYSFHRLGCSGERKLGRVNYYFEDGSVIANKFFRSFHLKLRLIKPEVVIIHGLHHPAYVWLLNKMVRPRKIFIQNHAEKPLRNFSKILKIRTDPLVSGYFFSSRELAADWIVSKQIGSEKKIFEVMEASSNFHREQTMTLEGSPVYIWVGRLDSNKDPLTLVHSFLRFAARNPAARLYMIYPQQTQLLNGLRKIVNVDHIQFIGKIEHDSLQQWYSAADFIISTSHYEGSGIAVCEGMSCGCVPILTDISSFRMMTDRGKVGLLFQPGNVASLEEALERSKSMDTFAQRQRTLEQFRDKLSFPAIARDIIQAIS